MNLKVLCRRWDYLKVVIEMSKLEQLINELCPNGVEFKKIKDSYMRIKGTLLLVGKMKEIASDDEGNQNICRRKNCNHRSRG